MATLADDCPACAVRPGVADAAALGDVDVLDLAAHDIKNALNVVNSALDLMTEDPQETPDMVPLLRRSSGRIGRIVATLVELNRLVGGTIAVTVTEEPWGAVCDAALAEVAAVAQAKDVTVDRGGPQPRRVRCDRPLLERALTSLLDHAIAVSPRGGRVDLHAAATPEGAVRAVVGNRGPSLPAALLPTLFRPRSEGGDAILRRFGGWGLGIVFARLAIERQGGTLRAVSPYDGEEGMAFEITLS
jgi:signal transduction histidine kinase